MVRKECGGKRNAHRAMWWQMQWQCGGKCTADRARWWQFAMPKYRLDTMLKPYRETTYSRRVATLYLEKPKTRDPECFFDQAAENEAGKG
jgi:hypothetical protein